MKVRMRPNLLVVTAESDDERIELDNWLESRAGHAFALTRQDPQTMRFADLGTIADACREPLNITSQSADPRLQLISNFAHTPFELAGLEYASVEAFWQGLKYPAEKQRREIALLHGRDARRTRKAAPAADRIEYQGSSIRVGTWEHWRLMELACWAKFSQHVEAQLALKSTGARPLEHRTRRDSQTIPGVIMAEIWMKVRGKLAKQ